jgi:hypothetical protein
MLGLFFYPEAGGYRFLQNIGSTQHYIPEDRTLQYIKYSLGHKSSLSQQLFEKLEKLMHVAFKMIHIILKSKFTVGLRSRF